MSVHSLATTGATVTVADGDVVEITVTEQASTGFVWEVVSCPPGLELTDSTLVLAPAAPGASGRRTLRFTVTAAPTATTTLRLELRRPWEPQAAPQTVFEAHLVAAEA